MNRDTWKLVRRMKFHSEARATTAISAAMIRPARRSGALSAWMSSQTHATSTAVRHASPNSNLRLKSIFLHPAIERAAAQAQLAGRERNVEMVHAQRPLDHLPLELVEVEALADHRHDRRRAPARQREVLDPVEVAVGHDHRPFGGMAQRPDVARPIVVEQRLQ